MRRRRRRKRSSSSANSQVITDNMGSQEMCSNGDTDAAAALQRVTGVSVVDNQFVFVRGLVEIIPQRFARRQMFDAAFGLNWYENSTGENIPLSPLDGNNRLGL